MLNNVENIGKHWKLGWSCPLLVCRTAGGRCSASGQQGLYTVCRLSEWQTCQLSECTLVAECWNELDKSTFVIFYGTCQLVAPGEVQKDQAVSFQRQVGHSEPPDLEMQTGTSSPCIDWLVHFVMLPAASFAANQSECSMRSMWRKLPHEELRLMQSQGEAVQPPSSSAAQLQLFHLTTES